MADTVAGFFGPVGPLLSTIPFLLVAFVVPFFMWDENYGNASISLRTTLGQGVAAIAGSRHVFLLGLMQTLFEGSMHVFVFMWTPTLQGISGVEKKELPLGQIFSCFMACMAVGSSTYSLLLQWITSGKESKSEVVGAKVFLLAGASFLATFMVNRFELAVLSFVMFEVTCGLYFPMISTLRSQHIPEKSRAAVMSLFRLPVNIVVVLVLIWSSSWPSQQVFLVLAMCQLVAALAYVTFQSLPKTVANDKGYFPAIAGYCGGGVAKAKAN